MRITFTKGGIAANVLDTTIEFADRLVFLGQYDGYVTDGSVLLVAPVPERTAKTLDILFLFTRAERIAIRNSADDNVRDFWDMLGRAPAIGLDQTQLKDDLRYLVQIGLLTQQRAKAIFNQ